MWEETCQSMYSKARGPLFTVGCGLPPQVLEMRLTDFYPHCRLNVCVKMLRYLNHENIIVPIMMLGKQVIEQKVHQLWNQMSLFDD